MAFEFALTLMQSKIVDKRSKNNAHNLKEDLPNYYALQFLWFLLFRKENV